MKRFVNIYPLDFLFSYCFSAPSAVLDLTANFIIDVPSSYNASSGLYEGTLNISWREPLTPNGVITNYNYLIIGPSPLTSTVVDDNNTDTTVQVGIGLTPDETYTISVTASTIAGPGPSSTVNITVPEAGGFVLIIVGLLQCTVDDVSWCMYSTYRHMLHTYYVS